MKKKIIIGFIVFFSFLTVYALSSKFNLDFSKLSFSSNKDNSIASSLNKDYSLSYSFSESDSELVNQIKELSKKTTYLMLGDFNNVNETSENFYNRKKQFYALRYNPTVPKDSNSIIGLDESSEEYKDDLVSGYAVPTFFQTFTDLNVLYNSFGDIRVSIGKTLVLSAVYIPNARIKVADTKDPMKYTYEDTNLLIYYYYKKLGDEWKLYYIYAEYADTFDGYFSNVESGEDGSMSIAPTYNSELSKIYNFNKLNNLDNSVITNIYNKNNKNVVFLNSYYNNMVVATANGFFINNGLVVTTWNFLEKALMEGQYIVVTGANGTYELEGIVTINPEVDIAVLKVKSNVDTYVKVGNYKSSNVEDPVITLSSKTGVGVNAQKGIIVLTDNYIQSTIPLTTSDEGSPLFNTNGEVIGMNTAKSVNSSISLAINSDALKEVQDKFKGIDNVSYTTFDELKSKYYYTNYNSEVIKNNIPSSKWNTYKKIGDIENSIKLEIIKASYKDGIVSLRYKNNVPDFVENLKLSALFREKLIEQGYTLDSKNSTKYVFSNDKYQVVIMDEFDYLIVVMVKK